MTNYTTKPNSVVRTTNHETSDELYVPLYTTIKFIPTYITNSTYYTVFDGPYSGCYYSYSDACEAAWHSTELVGTYKKLTSAKYALSAYKKKNGVS